MREKRKGKNMRNRGKEEEEEVDLSVYSQPDDGARPIERATTSTPRAGIKEPKIADATTAASRSGSRWPLHTCCRGRRPVE